MIFCVTKGKKLLSIVLNILTLTVIAYGLFFAYDVLTVKSAQVRGVSVLFYAGCLLVIAAACALVFDQAAFFGFDFIAIASLVCAAASFALMVKALFFSLPSGTYTDPEQGRPTYQKGMYALCRHPGVLWYCLFFLFVALAFRTNAAVACCAILCAGNIAYMVFQDMWSFPRTFCDYAAYRDRVPFFLPTAQSMRAAVSSSAEGGRA